MVPKGLQRKFSGGNLTGLCPLCDCCLGASVTQGSVERPHLVQSLRFVCIRLITPFKIHTPPVENLPQVFHRGSVIFKWIGMLSSSIQYSHPLCGTFWFEVPQRVYTFHVEVPSRLFYLILKLLV